MFTLDFVLSLRFLITVGVVLLPLLILLAHVWMTWSPMTPDAE